MKRAQAVVGLGFGDEGKGVTVDRLCALEKPDLVVRFNGGYQAAHYVQPSTDGPVHCFSQFCAGTLAGVPGHLSRYVAVEPVALRNEAKALQENHGVTNPYEMLTVDPFALVVTPWHRFMNQQEEAARGVHRHGSCGLGIWEAVSHQRAHPDEAICVAHLKSGLIELIWDRLERIRRRLEQERGLDTRRLPTPYPIDLVWTQRWMECALPMRVEMDEYALSRADAVVFEGAQGVLLDEHYGFHPHTSASTSTFAQAQSLAQAAGCREFTKIGVMRSHLTRHGAGPLPTEDPSLPMPRAEANGDGPWQGAFRVGAFDEVLLRYALDVCGGVDALVVTHLDYPQIRVVDAPCTLGLPKTIEDQEHTTALLGSSMFSHESRPPVDVSDKELVRRLHKYADVRMGGYGPTRTEYLTRNT